jgi:GNAT superfamily N-acetyltransferase
MSNEQGSVEIHPLGPRDHARWTQLWAAYQLFYGVVIPAQVTVSVWERIQAARVHALGVTESARGLIGFVHYFFHEDTWSNAPACYLQDLYVDPQARGAGNAQRLIQAVAQASKAAGGNSPYWLTHESNAVARRLYDRVGKNHGFIQYTYVDG